LNFSKFVVLFSSFLLFMFFTPGSQGQIDDATRKLSYDIFKQLIEINTTDSVGSRVVPSAKSASIPERTLIL
jgi:hypothetical protein